MRLVELSITALPAWIRLNNIMFYDVKVREIEGKGFGLVTERPLKLEDTFNALALLRVSKELILSTEAVGEHAKVDKEFRDLLAVAGGTSTRHDILLFLLMQTTIASLSAVMSIGVSNPWSEYVKMLPSTVPVPTTWTEEERVLLVGTSLESPVAAKIAALQREFETLRELTGEISWCQKVWWEPDSLTLNDWILLDSWYRSRCLELPDAGPCMVPCLDIVNHSQDAKAYYERVDNGDLVLLLKPNESAQLGEEITINYGSSKNAAEMLFTYGFIDEGKEIDNAVIDLSPLPDDPLGKAKVVAFSGRAEVRISSTESTINWSSPFILFICVNEEDGLEFRVLQQTDGSQSQLQVFWQGENITESTVEFEQHITHHPLKDVFYLRAVCILENRLQQQLERLYATEDMSPIIETSMTEGNGTLFTMASKLRLGEAALLRRSLTVLNIQKASLIESQAVIAYFKSARSSGDKDGNEAAADEDFS